MERNWKTVKIVLGFVVIFAAIFWATDSVRSRSYTGTNLSFDAGSGPVVVTNPSDQPVAVQLSGAGSRTFHVSSTIEDVTGSSTRVESGSSRIQQFEFLLPPGTSEFTTSGGTDVIFVVDTDTELQATINPMSSDSGRSTLIFAAVVVLVSLYFISRVTEHQWIKSIRHSVMPASQNTPDPEPVPVVASGGQGRSARAYGDNRTER